MKRAGIFTILALLLLCADVPAQIPPPPPVAPGETLSGPELDQLLGPIALYPDPLIALVLPAATLPDQVAAANQYVNGGGDPNAIDQQPWDPSIQGLARYPTVLAMMAQSIDWATALGQVFVNQQSDVMGSIQRLRAQAEDLGNLESSPEDNVISEDGTIEIVPANPDLLYVPTYVPGVVFYQRPYGRHFLTFGTGFHVGPWLNHDFDWRGHSVVVWDRDHPRPTGWWNQRPSEHVRVAATRGATVWHAPGRPVAINRPGRGWDETPRRPEPGRPVRGRPEPGRPEPGRPEPVRPAPGRPIGPEHRPEVKAVEPRPAPSRPVVIGHTENTVASRVEPARGNAGVQSATEARAASNRGQASRQTEPRPAPVIHSAPPPAHPTPPAAGGRKH